MIQWYVIRVVCRRFDRYCICQCIFMSTQEWRGRPVVISAIRSSPIQWIQPYLKTLPKTTDEIKAALEAHKVSMMFLKFLKYQASMSRWTNHLQEEQIYTHHELFRSSAVQRVMAKRPPLRPLPSTDGSVAGSRRKRVTVIVALCIRCRDRR
jgi:hypothetical protein